MRIILFIILMTITGCATTRASDVPSCPGINVQPDTGVFKRDEDGARFCLLDTVNSEHCWQVQQSGIQA